MILSLFFTVMRDETASTVSLGKGLGQNLGYIGALIKTNKPVLLITAED